MPKIRPQDITAAEILALTSAKNLPNTYILGSFASKVTISSQQNRAFNLIWALKKSGIIEDGDEIGVVGGGFAGLSAAAGALLSKCKVTLYEESPQLLHIQRGNLTRYLHPYILDWPEERSKSAETKFPYLNWSANVASQVVESVLRQWSALSVSSHLSEHLNCRVTSISSISNRPVLTFNHGRSIQSHKVVIIAVGFGVEKPIGGVRAVPYWDDDSLHKPVVGEPKPRHYFVTGCGDGGLIDVLRLRFPDFRHDRFVGFISGHPKIRSISKNLLEIEKSAAKFNDPDEASFHLFEQYRNLISKEQALEILEKTPPRLDTTVLLNGSTITPLTFKSSILNRFAIYLLMASDDPSFFYQKGRLGNTSINREKSSYQIALNRSSSSTSAFDSIVIRHGPEAAIPSIIGAEQDPDYDLNQDIIFSSKKKWPAEFYSKVEDVVTETGKHTHNEFTRRADDFNLFLEAVRMRLLGDPSCEKTLQQITYSNREQRGFAEFELALLYFGQRNHKDALRKATLACNILPHIFRDSAKALAILISHRQGGNLKKFSLVDRERENPFAHSFSSYTALQKGWAHLLIGAPEKADATWRTVNQSVSYFDILTGYPFCQQTLPLDQLLIDLLANPNFDDPSNLKSWTSGTYVYSFKRCGLMGHHLILTATAEIIAGSSDLLKKFEDYASTWKRVNKPDANGIKQRLDNFLGTDFAI